MIPCRVLGPDDWCPRVQDGSAPVTRLPRGDDRLVLAAPSRLLKDIPRGTALLLRIPLGGLR